METENSREPQQARVCAVKPRQQRFGPAQPFTLCRHLHVYFARMRLLAVLKATLDSWLDTERERLALWLPVFMGAGVLAYYTLRFEPAPWVGAAVALPAIGLASAFPGCAG
jgi:hypothetical protein